LKISEDVLETIRFAAKQGKDDDLRETLEKYFGAVKPQKSFAQEVEEYVMSTDGYFSSTEILKSLHVSTDPEERRRAQKNISIILRRLKDRGLTEKYGPKGGVYRKIERECEGLDWQNAPTDDMPIEFPLGIHELVNIYPGNIIAIAGYKDSGKTAFALNFARLNMDKYETHYFSSEMGESELHLRLNLFKNMEKEDWGCKFWERNANFADVIRPDAINIIDYIEIIDDHWLVGRYLSDIHNKLRNGIALIALQKPYGRDIARGGESSLDKPRLYLSMNPGEMKIYRAKNWKDRENPNGKIMKFKLYSGWDFTPTSFWARPQEEE